MEDTRCIYTQVVEPNGSDKAQHQCQESHPGIDVDPLIFGQRTSGDITAL